MIGSRSAAWCMACLHTEGCWAEISGVKREEIVVDAYVGSGLARNVNV